MTPEVVYVAATKADGSLVIMTFVTRGLLNAFGDIFERAPSDANIEAELAKSRIECVSWRRISAADIPTDRMHRAAWVDTGTEIVVDPARLL